MQQLAMSFDEKPVEETKTAKAPMYTYRVIGIKDCGEYFVFRHRVIPGKGRRKAEIKPDWQGDNLEGRFPTIEEARAEKDRLEKKEQEQRKQEPFQQATNETARHRHKPLSDEEMESLTVKPLWWIEQHKPIEITGYKMPYGIQIKTDHAGIEYEGMLYPVSKQ